MPLVSIIITNWNGKRWLPVCLEAVRDQTFTDFEVIFVDDDSSDESADWVEEQFPEVRVIRQTPHLGFAGANNVGIRAAKGEVIVTLNNDTKAEPTWLQELVVGLNAPDVGMVATQMLIWDKPELLDSAGIEVDWAGFGWNRGAGKAAVTFNRQQEVFGPCAGAALYRRSMLEDIGLFDEDFYAYYEDVDLAWRAQRAGWRCIYVPTARVFHYQSGTARLFHSRKIFLLSRNRIWTIVKNVDRRDLWWSLPVILAYDFASMVYQLIRTRRLAPLLGRWQAIIGVPRMFSRRSQGARRLKLRPVKLGLPAR